MSLEVKIHAAQLLILRELLFQPSANYASLQRPTGLTSDHFNFHIARLVDLGLVEKIAPGQYRLSNAGKEYANKLDTAENTIERQPKLAVMLMLQKASDTGAQYLIQERVKNPHFGFFGFPTGKIRWGETVIETAQRECQEETGLTAEFEVAGMYHEHTFLEEPEELIEDKLFFICKATALDGELKQSFEGGKNQWLTIDELLQKEKRFSSVESELSILTSDTWLIEKTVSYPREKF